VDHGDAIQGTQFEKKTPDIPAANGNSSPRVSTGKKILPPDFFRGLQAKPLFSR
jgi:hypothetical protein